MDYIFCRHRVKSFERAREMRMPPIGRVSRRVTRRSHGSLIEDLRVDRNTSKRLPDRALMRAEDIEVSVEIDAINDEPRDDVDTPLVNWYICRTNRCVDTA